MSAGTDAGPFGGTSFGGVLSGAGGVAGSSAGALAVDAGTSGLGGMPSGAAGSAGLGEGGSSEPQGGRANDPGSLDLPHSPCEPPLGDWCQRIVGVDSIGQFEVGVDRDGKVLVAGGAVWDSHQELDVAVLKLEPSGEIIWGRQLGSDFRDWTEGMAVDPDGNAFVVGASADNDYSSPFIAKVSAAGELLWFEKPDVLRHAAGVAADADGNAVLLVQTGDLFKYAPNGDILWQKPAGHFMGGADVAVDGNGDILAILNLPDDGYGLAKLSAKGEVLWEKALDDDDTPLPYKVAAEPGGDIFLLGVTGMQEYLSRYSGTGELLWSQAFDPQKLTTADNLALDESGNIFVVGMATDFGKPWYDGYLVKYDPDGQFLWGEALGQRGSSAGRDVAVSPDGAAYVAGDLDSGAFVTRITPP